MTVVAFKSVHKEDKEMHNNGIHAFSAHYSNKYASNPAVCKETLKRFPQHVLVSNVPCSSSFFCQMNKYQRILIEKKKSRKFQHALAHF